MNKLFKIILFSAISILPLTTFAQEPQEVILSYHSDIQIQQDASMVVTETIKVISTGNQIRHGIYRDFPIAYKDTYGNRYIVGFEILDFKRDGYSEPYHIQKSGNGERIYIGDAQTFVATGEHAYSLTYKTTRQLGFFKDHDELYWNVTGNGWVFPIKSASATVTLPGNIAKENITTTFYTGSQGSTAQDATAKVSNSTAEFNTTSRLNSYQGLTIVVGWPKGIVTPPTATQNFLATLWANLDYIVGILGFILVFTFYLFMWNQHGKDPKKGTVIPFYEAPNYFSPALLRYITRMGSDNRGFTSSIINMAVKGALTVKEEKGLLWGKTYILTKKEGFSDIALTNEEKILLDALFIGGNSFELKRSNATTILAARSLFEKSLKEETGKKYFIKNTSILAIGVIFSLATIAGTIAAAATVRFGVSTLLQVLFWPTLFIAFLVTNIVFAKLVKTYTQDGRKLADEIEGFKLFLSVTEKDRLSFHNPPEKTPELFEKFLPYALALGVEHKWAQQFTQVFAALDAKGTSYAPLWYYGSFTHFSPDTFASEIGNTFTGVVSSSSTPPSSSSGFSGGSSGGGGGGGGGGGW